MDTIEMAFGLTKANIPLKKQYIVKKVIADDRGEGTWLTPYEHGHYAHAEFPTMYDPTDSDSVHGWVEYAHQCDKLSLDNKLGQPFFIEGDKQHEWYGPHCMNYHIWLRKIKEAFDPQNIADSGFYITSKKET